jgi:nucleoside diphosphate kinase
MNKLEGFPAIDTGANPHVLRRDNLAEQMKHRAMRMTPSEIAAKSLAAEDISCVGHIIDVFKSKEFRSLINQGNITVAMVRPQANDSKLDGTDSSASHEIIEEIKKNQHVILEFSCIFSRRMCGVFYSGRPKEVQESMAGIRMPNITRWEEFVRLMTSGPTTVLILHSQANDAIPRWRKQIGVLKNTESDATTIRGKFGSPDDYNNLVHGSDSIESVHREIHFFHKYLAGIAVSAKNR